MPNACLFAGDEGVGKRQFALELAKAFVCTEPDGFEACGGCAACRRSDTFVFTKSEKGDDYDCVFFSDHPDVGQVIPFKRNVRVGAIRELEREANFRPFEARGRFLIVDDADKMNDAAANALLKTLEEPPPTSHIFLITSRPDSLLPTIRSRCQTLRFAPVEAVEIEKFLIEDRAFTHDEARLASHLAGGSVGRALSINVENFKARRERMLAAIGCAVETRDRTALLEIAEEMNDSKDKGSFERDLDTLQSLLHDLWTIAVTGETERLANPDVAEKLERLAQRGHNADVAAWIGEIDTIRETLAVNINRKIAADSLLVSMASA